jgi:hypothetical protein
MLLLILLLKNYAANDATSEFTCSRLRYWFEEERFIDDGRTVVDHPPIII